MIPHPQVASRPFWLRELAELAPATFPSEGAALPPWAQVGDGRRRHIERVAGLLAAWAMARGMPPDERRRWLRAGFLHDAVRDAPADTLARLAGDAWESPSLRHGPAAAVLAEEAGETDRGVLDAVRFHSVGYAGWDDVGRMLYLADYLEPGRSHRRAHRAELAGRVPADPEGTLRAVADERRRWLESSGLPAPPESIAFWTALREDA